MSTHVIVGAGAVGSSTARHLAERGDQVKLVTRSGSGPEHPAIERIALDATDADRLSAVVDGAAALYNCANPQYHQWFRDWPPLHAALLASAERTGATLVSASCLYMYGPVSAPMTPSTPMAATHPKLRLRGEMWSETLALHEAGRIHAVEVRGSDYIEAQSILSYALGKPLLDGARGWVPAPLDVPHSWTSVHDMARTLATVSTEPTAWGRVWHAPTNEAHTIRELAVMFADANGAPAPKVSEIPFPVMWAYGLFDPMVRELRTTRYQFTRPFILDSSATQTELGLAPTPLMDALRTAGAALRG
ncbi:MAG TPA: FAD-dependent oxidoreductase [Micromonosporaceae bacterium]|jgi:nucleoside-diphosphate-sugar epimerase